VWFSVTCLRYDIAVWFSPRNRSSSRGSALETITDVLILPTARCSAHRSELRLLTRSVSARRNALIAKWGPLAPLMSARRVLALYQLAPQRQRQSSWDRGAACGRQHHRSTATTTLDVISTVHTHSHAPAASSRAAPPPVASLSLPPAFQPDERTYALQARSEDCVLRSGSGEHQPTAISRSLSLANNNNTTRAVTKHRS
jgi:hypothetical protein